MAVAGDAASPSPPPPPSARIVVSAQALVRFVVLPLLYLDLATGWVLSAIGGAMAVARLAWREGSAPFVFLLALADAVMKFSICIIFPFLALAAVMLCGLCLRYVIAVVSGSASEFKKSAFGAITWESTRELLKFLFPHAVVLGLVADLAFILLSVAGTLVMWMSPSVEGSISQGEVIGSVISDVGIIGFHAIYCFVLIPALALRILRLDQEDRKAGVTVAVC